MYYKDPSDIKNFLNKHKSSLLIIGVLVLLLVSMFFLWNPIKSDKIGMEFSKQQKNETLPKNSVTSAVDDTEQKQNGIRTKSPLGLSLRDYAVLITPQKNNKNDESNSSFYKMVLEPKPNNQNNIPNDADNYTDYTDYSDYSDIDDMHDSEPANNDAIDYVVGQGDTLNKILVNKYGVKYTDVMLLIESNKQLSNLKIGQKISFKADDSNGLVYFEVYINKNKQLIYERLNDTFIERVNEVQGIWKDFTLQGEISTNLGKDGQQSGLTTKEIADIEKILQTQIDFKKIMPKDKFSVIVSREMIGDNINKSELKAIKFFSKNQNHYAFLADDSHYYDESANGLALAFLERPVSGNPRISSRFNPKRLNPVTNKVAPHNGVDFAVSVGTPVYAIADGVVTVSQYSPTAGNFIAIKHNSQYLTRYMHNKKLLVKAGEFVKKGQQIAVSGNTGRTTGPHLHFELHINGKPVDPITANLPKTMGLTGKEKKIFLESAKKYDEQLNSDLL